MCTVTYIPLGKNEFILTSNRDESPFRKTVPPETYIENKVKLTYPKDEVAGGTWIGLSDKNRLVCLLNGGFEKHKRVTNYKMSRGIIVKQLLKVENAVDFIKNFDFKGIEPFTIVLVDWHEQLKAYELVWTGEIKHFEILKDEPRIWSSATLYNKEMKELREVWFADWLGKTKNITEESILEFHKDETKGSLEVTFKMKRPNVETVSVTSVRKSDLKVTMNYDSLI